MDVVFGNPGESRTPGADRAVRWRRSVQRSVDRQPGRRPGGTCPHRARAFTSLALPLPPAADLQDQVHGPRRPAPGAPAVAPSTALDREVLTVAEYSWRLRAGTDSTTGDAPDIAHAINCVHRRLDLLAATFDAHHVKGHIDGPAGTAPFRIGWRPANRPRPAGSAGAFQKRSGATRKSSNPCETSCTGPRTHYCSPKTDNEALGHRPAATPAPHGPGGPVCRWW